jgi:hypothetical protein
VPAEVESEYQLFAVRCSKCHSLSRALDGGKKDDDYWKVYVTRMRRQPQSGISPEEEAPILRFLHYYSARRGEGAGDGGMVDAGEGGTQAAAQTPTERDQ